MAASDCLLLAASAALAAGDLDGAATLCREALDHDPDHVAALHGLASIEQQRGRFAAALPLLDRALRQPGASWHLHNACAVTLAALERPAEAVATFDAALALNPDEASLHLNRAIALMALQQDEAALASFTRTVALAPHRQPAWNNKAILEMRLHRLEDALASCDRLVALDPRDATAHQMRGKTLLGLSRAPDALAAFDDAAALAPLPPDAVVNQASALAAIGRGAEGMALLDGVLQQDPHSVPAHWTAAFISLALGDFSRGWREYEWRWHDSAYRSEARRFAQPLWLGDTPLAGHTILLHAEQGFGDTIQFCRYAALVRDLGARVILEAPAPLLLLLRTLEGPDELVATGAALPPFDCHCPLMSLPLALGTTVTTIPARIPYLAVYRERSQAWRERLGPRTNAPRIGLAWSGLPTFRGDRTRSAPLRALAGLIRPGFQYFGVQKDVREADRLAAADIGVTLLGEHIADFADAAAISAQMDLIISVDTAPAHLAGALGHPVWLLLPHAAEWRWMTDRADSPWYPTATLFRQQTPLDWEELAHRVGRALVR